MKNIRAVTGMALAGVALTAYLSRAGAHYPEIDASFVCTDNVVHATVRSTSWVTGDDERRHNDHIEITWDGRAIGRGSFSAANDYSFEIRYDTAPDGRTHTVRATAKVAFGREQQFDYAGTSRETTLTLPDSCAPATSPTTTVTTTTTTTTTTTASPPTTARTEVLGETVTLPPAQPAIPVVVQPSFTG